MYEQYSLTKDHFVILSFKGVISQEILVYLGSMIKSSLNLQSKKIKKVFAVFIELAQNILHYSAERNVDNEGYEGGVGILQTTEENEIYYVSAGNMVKNSQIESIKKNCEYVNSLSKEDLKIYYQVKIKQDRPQGSKGAGLGFIDIARKCDGPLEYKFNQIDEKHSFFTLSVSFKRDET
ncbi:MAG: SiaB family protein kinase [Leptospiraceae bacterium]|nr:SiaB family protein kinase [Leptospiraceae bacterium]